MIDDVSAYKEELLTKKEKSETPDSTTMLMDKLKEMGIGEKEEKEEENKEVEAAKKKWTNLNVLVKELSQTVV